MSMNMRTISMAGAGFAYILLILPLTRVRAQSSPAAPEPPSFPFPAIPAVPAAPAEPVVPSAPAIPEWPNEHSRSTHWGDAPAADCSDLHVRLDDERPTIEAEERTVTKAEA